MYKLYKYMSDRAFIHRQYIIKNLMINNNVLILTSGTGLGKTTKVPLFMIELFTKKGLLGEYTILENGLSNKGLSNSSSYADFGLVPQAGQDPAYPHYDYTNKSYSLPYINEKSRVLCAVPKNILVDQNSNRDSFIVGSIRNTTGPNNSPIISGISNSNSNNKNIYGEALTFLTSGYLNQLMIEDPYLTNIDKKYNISCVILDEAHERSLDIDILLVNLKKILLIRPDFKVVIMSATINTDLFTKYFFNAPLYHVNPIDKQFNVVINYLTKPCYSHIYAILETLKMIIPTLQRNQHILIFVTGNNDRQILFKAFNIISEQITTTNSINGQQIVQNPIGVQYVDSKYDSKTHPFTRFTTSTIFIATNAIESSVTIPNLAYVIDAGLAFNSGYDSKLDFNSLNNNAITTPSADQRKGRVGRMMDGTCYRLYTKKYFEEIMKKETVPEIFKTNIESVFIKILNKQQNFLNFDFIQCPSKDQCFYTLQKLIKYDIIPSDYNICTVYDELSENNKRNIQIYSKLSYIKIGNPLTIDNILLHIIIDYYNNNEIDEIFKDMVKVIIVSALYLGQQIKSSPPGHVAFPRWDPSSQEISEIFYLYNNVFEYRELYVRVIDFSAYFNAFMQEFCKLFEIEPVVINFGQINQDNKTPIITQINKILSLHGHICKIGSINFNDSNNQPKTYYFGSQSIDYKNVRDYETEYTYIKGLIINNNIQLSLLTRYGPTKGGEYNGEQGQKQYEDQKQDNNYYGGGYEDEYEDEYEYENKYIDF